MKTLKFYTHILLLLTLGIGFSSCERDAVNVDIPLIQSKLVVQCFISPQNPVTRAHVSFSSPIYGNSPREDWIRDAKVEITNGTTQATLVATNFNGRPAYEIDSSAFKIEAGQTYTLYVSTTDGRKVNAQCSVPFAIDASTLTYNWDTIVKIDQNVGSIERTVRLNMKWRDAQQGENFYRVGANVLVCALNDTTITFRERMSNNRFSDLFTDEGEDGKTFERNSLEQIVAEQIGGSVNEFSFRPKGIDIYILNCDKNYYRYHKTAENNNGEDPFSEPTLVFSNIIGGLGCFGASNRFIETIQF